MSFVDFPEYRAPVELLQRSLQRGRLGHAYLFAGAELEPLEPVARTLAKTLNCARRHAPTDDLMARVTTGGNVSDSCDECDSCRRIDADNHGDVQWLRPGKKTRVISVDQVRELIRGLSLRPNPGGCKVGILVGVDRLRPEAANAFLKTLEEPPGHAVLILLTSEPAQILETILSRCLRLTFGGEARRLSEPGLLQWLRDFAAAAPAQSGSLLGRYQVLSNWLQRLGELKSSIETTLTEKSPLEKFDDIEPALRDQWEGELTAAIEAEYRHRRGDMLLAVERWLRDIWLTTQGHDGSQWLHPELGDYTRFVAGRITPVEALENIQSIERTYHLLATTNVQEPLTLEVALLRLKL